MITTRVPQAGLPAVAAAVALALICGGSAFAQDDRTQENAAEGEAAELTVMARNLYLGADVSAGLDLLPDVPAAAQAMWEQVDATDFDVRVSSLAAEAERNRPDVIGLQEATVWSCRTGISGLATPVYDFTERFLLATAAAGVPYVVAEHEGVRAENPGFEFPAIPWTTTVDDPDTFGPLFDSDSADCGFATSDALLVRADLADSVVAAGTSEFDDRHAIVPVVFTVDRGYAWADLAIAGTTVRVVSVHLESMWDEGEAPTSVKQATQLVDDLSTTTVPVVVLGDFNSDPRDPRATDAPNPADQPVASERCPAQPADPTPETTDPTCSAYWTMRAAGYADAGPDALDPANYTWGAAADLSGPDPDRLPFAQQMGNPAGFTDRLDYVFVGNGATATNALLVGHEWPDGPDLWPCESGSCLPSDHAGIVATIDISAGPSGAVEDSAPEEHDSFRIGLLGWLGIILGALAVLAVALIVAVVALVRRGLRGRATRPE